LRRLHFAFSFLAPSFYFFLAFLSSWGATFVMRRR
jgi:hypothetical protein